jgi:hypothetical protein
MFKVRGILVPIVSLGIFDYNHIRSFYYPLYSIRYGHIMNFNSISTILYYRCKCELISPWNARSREADPPLTEP